MQRLKMTKLTEREIRLVKEAVHFLSCQASEEANSMINQPFYDEDAGIYRTEGDNIKHGRLACLMAAMAACKSIIDTSPEDLETLNVAAIYRPVIRQALIYYASEAETEIRANCSKLAKKI